MEQGFYGFPKGLAPYDIACMYSGVPTASLIIAHFEFPRLVWFPASLKGSRGRAITAATAQADFDLQKNGASVGTIRFAAAGTTVSFIMAQSQAFTVGDALKIIAPTSPDATLADITFTLAGIRIR